MTLGEKIKEVRKQQGMTQKQVGDCIGVSEAMIRHYENNWRKPKVDRLYEIAEALDYPLEEFLVYYTVCNRKKLLFALMGKYLDDHYNLDDLYQEYLAYRKTVG